MGQGRDSGRGVAQRGQRGRTDYYRYETTQRRIDRQLLLGLLTIGKPSDGFTLLCKVTSAHVSGESRQGALEAA